MRAAAITLASSCGSTRLKGLEKGVGKGKEGRDAGEEERWERVDNEEKKKK